MKKRIFLPFKQIHHSYILNIHGICELTKLEKALLKDRDINRILANLTAPLISNKLTLLQRGYEKIAVALLFSNYMSESAN